MGPTNEKLRKLRLKGLPPHPLFLSSLVPDWPEEINKILDSKYRPLREEGPPEEREIKIVGANPLILIFSIFHL